MSGSTRRWVHSFSPSLLARVRYCDCGAPWEPEPWESPAMVWGQEMHEEAAGIVQGETPSSLWGARVADWLGNNRSRDADEITEVSMRMQVPSQCGDIWLEGRLDLVRPMLVVDWKFHRDARTSARRHDLQLGVYGLIAHRPAMALHVWPDRWEEHWPRDTPVIPLAQRLAEATERMHLDGTCDDCRDNRRDWIK